MRVVGAFEFLLSFLYIHYIGFPEKHQAGLRVGVMQYALLAAVSAYRVFVEAGSSAHSPHGQKPSEIVTCARIICHPPIAEPVRGCRRARESMHAQSKRLLLGWCAS